MDAPPNLFCGAELGGWVQWISSWRNDPGNREIQDFQIPQLAKLAIVDQPSVGSPFQKATQLSVSMEAKAAENPDLQVEKAEADKTKAETSIHFSSFPDKVLKLFLDRMKTTDRLRFRGVSRQFRSLSDLHPFLIKDLKLSFDQTGSKLSLDQRFYNFLPVMGSPDKTAHVTVALQRLLSLLKTPSLQLESLQIELLEFEKEGWQEVANEIVDALRRFHVVLSNRIHVKKFEMRWNKPDVLEEFLYVFEPQTLEHIKYYTYQRVWSALESDAYENKMIFSGLPQLSDMKQWKEAKTVELYAGVHQIMAGDNIDALDFFNEIHLNFGKNYSQNPECLTMLITSVNKQQTLKMDQIGWLRFGNLCRFLEAEVVVVENQHQVQFKDGLQTYSLCYTRHENLADTGILVVKNLNV